MWFIWLLILFSCTSIWYLIRKTVPTLGRSHTLDSKAKYSGGSAFWCPASAGACGLWTLTLHTGPLPGPRHPHALPSGLSACLERAPGTGKVSAHSLQNPWALRSFSLLLRPNSARPSDSLCHHKIATWPDRVSASTPHPMPSWGRVASDNRTQHLLQRPAASGQPKHLLQCFFFFLSY